MNVHGVRSLAAAVFLASSFPLAAFASVTINEIAWMGTSEEINGEWIELYNDGDVEVDLAGWKLFEAGGSTVIFTLTKKIESGGYTVVERTTPSVQDPLPGVNDEAGSFGGSGLNNTGEHLVLKDKTGQVVHDLDLAEYGGKWPAGDGGTKHTMQWNGTKWVTAAPTPKSDNALVDDEEKESDGSTSTTTPPSNAPSAHSSSAPLSSQTIQKLTLDAGRDRLVSAGVEAEFDAQAREGGSEASNIEYYWSFGDGAAGRGKRVTHQYRRQGTYVVIVNAEKAGRKAAMRFTVTAVEPLVRIRAAEGDRVELENASEYEVNIQGWKLKSRKEEFVFPRDTILLPKSTVQFDADITGLSGTSQVLEQPDGHEVKGSPEGNASAIEKTEGELMRDIAQAAAAAREIERQVALLKMPRPIRPQVRPAIASRPDVRKPAADQVQVEATAATTTGSGMIAAPVEIYTSERADSRGFLAPLWNAMRRLWGGE